MPIVLTRASKQEARYKALGGVEHCSRCRFFMPQGTCGRIIGPVSPEGWCRFYSREMVQRWSNPGYAGGGAAPPTQDFDFTQGVMPPAITFTRGSSATYFDNAGVMRTAGNGVPRFDYDPGTLVLRGLLMEEPRTNSIRNSMMTGAVPGSPGTLPTNWGLQQTGGLTWSVIGTGVESGITYIDVRLTGTTTNNTPSFIHFEPNTTPWAASVGQIWASSFYVRLVGGSLSGLTQMSPLLFETPSNAQHASPPVWPTNAPLNVQRVSLNYTLATAGTTGASLSFKVNVTGSGVAVDATFRIGAPQAELGQSPSSFIATTNGVVTRPQDVAAVPAGAWLSPTTHTLEADYQVPFASLTAGVTNAAAALDDGTFSNQYVLRCAPGGQMVAAAFSANALVSNMVGAAYYANVTQKLISTFDSADLAGTGVVNGATHAPFTFTAAPIGLSRLVIGSGRSSVLNGWVRRVRYWPRLLSNAELVQATPGEAYTVDFTINGEIPPGINTTRNSIASYFDSTGTMQTVPVHTPRQDFDPTTLAMRGLLVEETRTNSILNSTMVGVVAGTPGTDPTGWTVGVGGTGLTRQIVGTGVDRGIAYVDYRFTAPTTVAGNMTFVFTGAQAAGVAAAAGQVWTQSLYIALAGGTMPPNTGALHRLNQWDATPANLGAITGPGASIPTTAPLATQRQRGVFPALAANCAWIQPFWLLGIAASASPVDFTLRVGAPQLELGAFATSFIPTTNATVTRINDIVTYTNAPINAAAGSLVAEVFLPQVPTANNNIEFAFIDQGSTTDCMGLRQAGFAGQATITFWVGNVNQMSQSMGTALNANAVNKVGLTYDRTSLAVTGSSNGSAPIAGTSAALPSPTRMTFGSGRNTLINGHVRKITYWPRALTDAELRQATT